MTSSVSRKNVLFITTDQHRKDCLGCYGNNILRTPVIDSLAARGVRFDNVFTAYPVCAPNRASMATGRYPTVHRLRSNGMRLPEEELTLMEVLRRAGYHTYGAGKMHFGPQWRFPEDGSPISDPDPLTAYDPQPADDEFPWYGLEQAALTEDHRTGPYSRYLARHGYDVWDELHSASFPQSATVKSAFPEEHHQTTWITDRAMEFLGGHPQESPFFMWVSYVHPHHPFNPPAPYDTMYNQDDMPLPRWSETEVDGWPDAYRSKYVARDSGHEAVGLCDFTDSDWRRICAYYYGMITQIDHNIGRIVDKLRVDGQLENTIIVFASDHGENLGDHRLLFKGTTYDCVTNVPLILAGPGVPHNGQAHGAFASSVDLMPTILELCGVDPPDPSPMQGISLVPAFADSTLAGRDAVLIENVGVRRSVRTHNALLTWHGPGIRGELYDLVNDPHCFKNLWDVPGAGAMKHELLDTLISLMAENVDPLPAKEGPW